MKKTDVSGLSVEGHIKIFSPETGEVFVNKRNAIHYENMSIAIAKSLASSSDGIIHSMVFGSGGTVIDPTGIITYLTPNTTGISATLYAEQYDKIVEGPLNTNPIKNRVEVRHVTGTYYSDLFVTCVLDYDEPSGQDAFDNSIDNDSSFVFDELGLRSAEGKLLTHVIFHPVQKSANRLIQIDYTVRIQSLTGMSEVL